MLPDDLLRLPLVVFVETILAVIAFILAITMPEKCIPQWRKISQTFDRLARREMLSIFLVGVLAFAGSMAVSLLIRFPEPTIHDEFSYLLAADTFASGRLTNPTHPLWRHFESIHIIQQPTYASKYPPAQGMMLALGQVVGGHPVVGVWLGIALACAAICWMLQAWLPRRWALLGGLLIALNLGFFGYWSQKYWGGAIAATGGAMLFGALRRLLKRPAAASAIILGIGLVILANSRPLEGLIASLPAAVIFLVAMFRSGRLSFLWLWLPKVIIPLGMVLCLGTVWMGYYNYRVTGKPWLTPYQVYENTYPSTPIFLWSSIKPVRGEPPQSFVNLWQVYKNKQEMMLTFSGIIVSRILFLFLILVFFLRYVFLIPLATLPLIVKNRWTFFAILTSTLVLLTVLSQVQGFPRKMAPVTGLIIFIAIQCFRQFRLWRPQNKRLGRCVGGLFIIILVISVAISFHPIFHSQRWPMSQHRVDLINQLKKDSARDVIVVRYGPDHFPHFIWVYNRADIDASDIIWARDLGEEENHNLFEYYQDRKIWLLEADRWTEGHLTLVPYPKSGHEKKTGE